MTFRLKAETAHALTERWHDQTLDLANLKFTEANRECMFTVLKPKPDTSAETTRLVKRKPLQRCCVTVKNVTHVQALDAEGEVELYIDEVEASPTGLRVKCVNGTLELLGDDLEISFEAAPSDADEVTLTTPLGDVSWRGKQKKTQS